MGLFRGGLVAAMRLMPCRNCSGAQHRAWFRIVTNDGGVAPAPPGADAGLNHAQHSSEHKP